MRKILTILNVVFLSVALGACSSSKKAEEGAPVDELPVDALTDPVPAPDAEEPAAASPEATPPSTDVAQAEATPPSTSETPAETPPASPEASAPSEPVAEATPEAPAVSEQTVDYAVQDGDTLMKIAFETYGDLYQWKKIYESNKDRISNPNAVPKGTVLKLEKPAVPVAVERNGEKYLIKLGDTLGKISDDVYGTKTKWKKIWENNKQMIHDPNRIFAGFYLYYTMTAEERQEAERLKQGRVTPAPLADAAPAGLPASPVGQDVSGAGAGGVVRAPANDAGVSDPAPAEPAANIAQ